MIEPHSKPVQRSKAATFWAMTQNVFDWGVPSPKPPGIEKFREKKRASGKAIWASGFTLLELVITLLLMTMALIHFAPMLAAGFKVYGTHAAIRELDNRLRPALERILREARGAVEFVTAGEGILIFRDLDGQRVIYDLSGGSLRRNGVDLARGVGLLSFTRNGRTLEVRISLSHGEHTLEMVGSVWARNM